MQYSERAPRTTAAEPWPKPRRGGWVALALALALLGGALATIALVRANRAGEEARAASAAAPTAPSGLAALTSYAGAAPANAAELAAGHTPDPAALPAAAAGAVARVHLTLRDRVIQVAPGVRYQ